MPVLFIGHGSPMNAIEQNEFTETWKKLASSLVKPQAILCISAHWETKGTFVTAMEKPSTIHDFGGFPKALFDVQYPAPGSPELATETRNMVQTTQISLDNSWGLDHGAWSIIMQLYPNADIPVVQLSIDYTREPEYHYLLAKQLKSLRNKGVLILGSGNMVHNLRMLDWNSPDRGFDWALEADETFRKLIESKNHAQLVNYRKLGKSVELAVPTPEHFLPLIYTLGMSNENDPVQFFNDKPVMGSLTMTSVQLGYQSVVLF